MLTTPNANRAKEIDPATCRALAQVVINAAIPPDDRARHPVLNKVLAGLSPMDQLDMMHQAFTSDREAPLLILASLWDRSSDASPAVFLRRLKIVEKIIDSDELSTTTKHTLVGRLGTHGCLRALSLSSGSDNLELALAHTDTATVHTAIAQALHNKFYAGVDALLPHADPLFAAQLLTHPELMNMPNTQMLSTQAALNKSLDLEGQIASNGASHKM